MKGLKDFLFSLIDEEEIKDLPTSPQERLTPMKSQLPSEVRKYTILLGPAFSEKLPVSYDPKAFVPLEFTSVQEQGLVSERRPYKDTKTELQKTALKQKGASEEKGAKGIYQRELSFTKEGIDYLQKNPGVLLDAYTLVRQKGSNEDFDELQFLDSIVNDETLSLEQKARFLNSESSRVYSPLVDTMIHLSQYSRGTKKPAAYSRLMNTDSPDVEDITTLQRQRDRDKESLAKKQRALDVYVQKYLSNGDTEWTKNKKN